MSRGRNGFKKPVTSASVSLAWIAVGSYSFSITTTLFQIWFGEMLEGLDRTKQFIVLLQVLKPGFHGRHIFVRENIETNDLKVYFSRLNRFVLIFIWSRESTTRCCGMIPQVSTATAWIKGDIELSPSSCDVRKVEHGFLVLRWEIIPRPRRSRDPEAQGKILPNAERRGKH